MSANAANPFPKYVKVNGVSKINPEYSKWNAENKKGASSLNAQQLQTALPVYTNEDEFRMANPSVDVTQYMADSTKSSKEFLADAEVLKNVGFAGQTEMKQTLDQVFAKYEIPMGLLNKLFELQTYQALFFLIDDSGSMASGTDSYDPFTRRQLTRWEETRYRLLELMEVLSYIPIPMMIIRFLNRTYEVRLVRDAAMTPQQFLDHCTMQVNQIFQQGPSGTTPYKRKIEEAFSLFRGQKIAWYFFGDGVPDGGELAIRQIGELVINRANPQDNPVTFLSCTNQDEDVEWMKDVEEIAQFCSECDDYNDEKDEVLKDQGYGLPYTKGFYLISCLVGAMNPTDLDAMDESIPFTKYMLDNLLGIVHYEQDYQSYFQQFVNAQRSRKIDGPEDRIKKGIDWQKYYGDFLRARTHAEMEVVQVFRRNLKNASKGPQSRQKKKDCIIS
ncbi:hypothetical protein HDU91_007381 [Kappamyces sp. JEL0680]|nr:hypothetical protein HDU91_007381 [Kappamyces sp. JEL0680]